MKKFVLTSMMLLIAALTWTSCLKDDDNSAEAQVSYTSILDSLQFTDRADTTFSLLIAEALYSDKIKLCGTASIFSEEAKVNTNSPLYAIAICDSLAHEDYSKKLSKVSLYDIKDAIYAAHRDSLQRLGIGGPELVPISPFTSYLSLYSSTQGKIVRKYTPLFQ